MHTNPQMVELHNPCPGDLFWWRGLSERNIFNQMPVCMLAYVHIKKWACPLRGSSRTCDCAKEGEVQSMHGDFVQQYIQNNKPCVTALFMQLNMAMLFPCLKASCLCHSAAHGHLLQIYWWISSDSERSAVQFGVWYMWDPFTAEWLCAVVQCRLFGSGVW